MRPLWELDPKSLPGPLAKIFGKEMHLWVGGWLADRAKRIARPAPDGVRHVLFAVCDHYEPRHKAKSAEQPAQRVRDWHVGYRALQDECFASFGLRPLHSWFYPPHHGYEHLPALAARAAAGGYALHDIGPSLEYNFLFFNLASDTQRLALAHDVRFRQAVSLAIDRASIARLVFGNRATPIWGHVTPGNRLWINKAIATPARSPERARALLREIGCRWAADGSLQDANGRPVSITLLAAAGNAVMTETATLLQADLKTIGIPVQIATLEFRALLDRVLKSRDYEAALLRLGSGDVDPNGEMNVWPSTGATHLWNPGRETPSTPWEAEIDRLMTQQLSTVDAVKRKALYDRVQAIVAEQLPIVPLVSPNIVVAARTGIGNLRPAVLDHYLLWNADELYWRTPAEARR